MAKKHDGRVTNITTPSPYGSHSSMVVDATEYDILTLEENQVVCKDDIGIYITTKDRLDSGLADPNRCKPR